MIYQESLAVGRVVKAVSADVLQYDVFIFLVRVLNLVGGTSFNEWLEVEACQRFPKRLDGGPAHGLLFPGGIGSGCIAIVVIESVVHDVEGLHALVDGSGYLTTCGDVEVGQSHAV